MLLKDIRDYQILFLCLFLVLGIGTRDWTLRPELIGVAIATCLLTQSILSVVKGHMSRVIYQGSQVISPASPDSLGLRSALITSLGLSLLLRADNWTTIALAGVCAIASKFFFRVGDKHVFNPANFGIITALITTPDAWVSPGQWGEDWWYGLLFLGTGGMILKRVGRWDTTAAFLGAYSLLEAIRNLWLGWTWDVYLHRLMSGSLLLFALFMVTDPRSIPNARIGRVVWAICIAILTFILRNYFFVPTAVFWALFMLAPLTILLDALWLAPQFSWLRRGGDGEMGGWGDGEMGRWGDGEMGRNLVILNSRLHISPSELGTSAFELGTSASELGTSAFELGTSAFELGTSPSELGTSPSELGTSPSELGTSASELGTSASELGTSAS